MNMGEENEDIIFDNRPARSLDDLDSRRDRGDRGNGRGRREGKGRDGRNGRGRKNQDDADMARLFINIGKEQKVKPGDILGAIAGESGISGRLVGSIDMYDKYTFVEVPQDCCRGSTGVHEKRPHQRKIHSYGTGEREIGRNFLNLI